MMQKFGITLAGLALLVTTAVAHDATKTEVSVKVAGMDKRLTIPHLPAKSDAIVFSEGNIRLKGGVFTSDKPMQVISRHFITILPSGGIRLDK